jgi:acyl-coenzyme A thioesterase PaaI-like protein
MMTAKTTKARKVKRKVRTSKGLKEYTYLGCPLTHNRSPWCFRMCTPDLEGHGRCGRVAPHALTGRIQAGIQEYNKKQRAAHCTKLESMYLAAPCNEYYDPGISVADGAAEVVISVQEKFLDAAGFVHSSVCHRAMSDAALFAVSSVVPKALMLTTGFDVRLTRSVAEGEGKVVARARVIGMSEDQCLAEAVLVNGNGEELGRGGGTFVKSDITLSAEMGYS